jgi:hypothetical protein
MTGHNCGQMDTLCLTCFFPALISRSNHIRRCASAWTNPRAIGARVVFNHTTCGWITHKFLMSQTAGGGRGGGAMPTTNIVNNISPRVSVSFPKYMLSRRQRNQPPQPHRMFVHIGPKDQSSKTHTNTHTHTHTHAHNPTAAPLLRVLLLCVTRKPAVGPTCRVPARLPLP